MTNQTEIIREALADFPFIGTQGRYMEPQNQYALALWAEKHWHKIKPVLENNLTNK